MYPIHTLNPKSFPPLLNEISDPPKKLYLRGEYPDIEKNIFLTIVGSRKYTPYGERVLKTLIKGLKGYPIVIISGLALGIDRIAHESALNSGLKTVAVPGSGLNDEIIYPKSNADLARKILKDNSCLLSEFPPEFKAVPWSFLKRNRIMAGLSHAVLVIECAEPSGTLVTARFATEYNRDVLAVPGPINSKNAKGVNNLIRNGATPITSSKDLLEALHIPSKDEESKLWSEVTEGENIILKALEKAQSTEELKDALDITSSKLDMILGSLEFKGKIQRRMGKIEKT